MKKPLVYLISAFLIASCSHKKIQFEYEEETSADFAREKNALEASNIIAPGFVLKIEHRADSSITGKYTVDFDGKVKLPYKKDILIAGQTPDQAAQSIRSAYRSFFKTNNTVKVDIEEKKYLVEIRGLVQNPGRYTVRLDSSIEELAAQAGGFQSEPGEGKETSKVKPEYLRIERRDFESGRKQDRWFHLQSYFYRFDSDPELLWRGGERLFFLLVADPNANVKRRWQTIQILGSVHSPGEFPVQSNSDLYNYIGSAGGPTGEADLKSVTVIRRSEGNTRTYDLTRNRGAVALKPGDIVLVKAIDMRPNTFEKILSYSSSAASIALAVFFILLL